MRKSLKWIVGAAVALVMTTVLFRTLGQDRRDPPDQEKKEENEEAVKTPSRVSIQNGQTVVTLDPEAQSRAGISVAPLVATTAREQVTAAAVILSTQDLVTARNNYVAGLARLEKARAGVEVAQQESDRLKALYQDNQNASQKALQSAQGTLRSMQADAQAAEQDLALEAAALRQSWGDVVTHWVTEDSPPLDRVFNQGANLVQVTLPPVEPAFRPAPTNAGLPTSSGQVPPGATDGKVPRAPETISLEIPGSGSAPAKLISPLPRVDPRIQGVSFLYVIRNRLGLAPGLNLVAHLAVGRLMHGVLVPLQAIVWWRAQAWVYKQPAPGRFVRQEIETGTQVEGGFFVSGGIPPGERVVVSGAQMLLSEELGSQGLAGGADTD